MYHFGLNNEKKDPFKKQKDLGSGPGYFPSGQTKKEQLNQVNYFVGKMMEWFNMFESRWKSEKNDEKEVWVRPKAKCFGHYSDYQKERLRTFLSLLAQEMIIGSAYKDGKKWHIPKFNGLGDHSFAETYRKNIFGIFPRASVLSHLQRQFAHTNPDNDLIWAILQTDKDEPVTNHNRPACNEAWETQQTGKCSWTLSKKSTDCPETSGLEMFFDKTRGRKNTGGWCFAKADPYKSPEDGSEVIPGYFRFPEMTEMSKGCPGEKFEGWYRVLLEEGRRLPTAEEGNKVPAMMYRAWFEMDNNPEVHPKQYDQTKPLTNDEFIIEWRRLDQNKNLKQLLASIFKNTFLD